MLEHLLAPCSLAQFWADYWSQQALHCPAVDQARFQSLFGWADLNHLLNYHHWPATGLRLSRDGQSLPVKQDPRQWREAMQQGATLILNEVQERVPALGALAAELSRETHSRAQINLYCSPAEQQGFDCHYDTHAVLVLQIEGEKEWFVYPETTPHPLSATRSPDDLPPTGEPYLQCVLRPGDVLFIPRGHWHYAIARDCLSLHLTAGLHTQTGLDWLSWLAHDLQEQSGWRRDVAWQAGGDLAGQMADWQQDLLAHWQNPVTLARYRQAVEMLSTPPLPLDLPLQIGDDPFAAGLMSRFAWPPLHPVKVVPQEEEGHYQIQIGSKQIDLKGVPASLVTHMSEASDFTVFDLADWGPDLDLDADLLPLLKRLVTEGVLVLKAGGDLG